MGNEACCQLYTDDEYKNQKNLVPSYLKQHQNQINSQPKPVEYIQKQVVQVQPEIELPILNEKMQNVWKTKEPFHQKLSNAKSAFIRRKFGKDVYEGELDETKRPNGLGKMYKQDGSLFVGQFINGVAEGPCFYILKNGSYYSGTMKKNTAECEKGYFYSEQLQYNGGFKNNHFDGKGIQKGQNSYSYDGTYNNGKKTSGLLKWGSPPQNYIYSGEFDEDGQFKGKGKLQQPTGKYQGEFLKGKKHGKGIYYYDHKLRYQGEYIHGEREGSGTIFNCDNSIAYKGQFKKGLPNGKGIALDSTGKQFQTEWIDGVDKRILN